MSVLKPCPFCAGDAEFRRSGRQGHYIACKGCDAASTLFTAAKDDVRQLLIETWNRRAPDAQADPTATAVTEKLDAATNDEALTKQISDFLLERDQQTSQDERDDSERETSALYIAQMVRRACSAALKAEGESR